MPYRDREEANAHSREYKRRMRADPVRKARERAAERALYARKKEQTVEARRAKNARYRAAHRAVLAEKQLLRYQNMDAEARQRVNERSRVCRKKRRLSDEAWRKKEVARTLKWREEVSQTAEYKIKNVARASKWKRELDLNAPENIQRRIALRLRNRLKKAVHRGPKTASAVRDLGCSVSDLMAHLGAQFHPGMTWANYGAWHIDHIRPLASFDLTDPEQASAACHFTNLQPLWAQDNQKKSWKYPQALATVTA